MEIGYLAHHRGCIPTLARHRGCIPTLARCFHEEWAYLYPERMPEGWERLIGERARTDAIPLALLVFEGTSLSGRYASSCTIWIRASIWRRGSPGFMSCGRGGGGAEGQRIRRGDAVPVHERRQGLLRRARMASQGEHDIPRLSGEHHGETARVPTHAEQPPRLPRRDVSSSGKRARNPLVLSAAAAVPP